MRNPVNVHAEDKHDESYSNPNFACAVSIGFELRFFKLNINAALLLQFILLGVDVAIRFVG